MSNPKHKPTDEQRRLVETLAGFGVKQTEICRQIGINDDTLRLHYRNELDSGVEKANANVAQSLYNKAMGDGPSSATSAIFWLKTRAGWKETTFIGGDPDHPLITRVECVIVRPKDTNC